MLILINYYIITIMIRNIQHSLFDKAKKNKNDVVMGVPITFLHKFNSEQFEISNYRKGNNGKDLRINTKPTFFRILVKRK